MKKTLEKVAPYLPYEVDIHSTLYGGLKHIIRPMSHISEYENDTTFDRGTGTGTDSSPPSSSGRIVKIGISLVVSEPENKLMLRPLSDLTKAIKHNGETFIPMVELAKIAFPKSNRHDLIDRYINLGHDYSLHFSKQEKSFDCRKGWNNRNWDENCYVPNQLKLLTKLYEWHFDVFGMIKAKLAVKKPAGIISASLMKKLNKTKTKAKHTQAQH